jgi:hypothetical protein
MIAERRASGRGLSQRARATTAKIHRKAPVARQHPKARLTSAAGKQGKSRGAYARAAGILRYGKLLSAASTHWLIR